MGRPKKVQESVQEKIEETIQEEKVLTVKEKYMEYCIQSRSNFVSGISQAGKMEILRYCESRIGHSIPLNSSCNGCFLTLIKLLDKIG